jgi:preprotein translocase subunit YajC
VRAFDTVLLYAAILAVAFWLLVLRPVRRQRAQRLQVVSQLAPGSRVLLTSGLLARVVVIEDGELVLDAGNGVLLRYVSGAVRTVLDEPDAPSEPPDRAGSDPPQGNSVPEPDVSDNET